MAALRSGLLREIVGMSIDTLLYQQDAFGADGARRCHRHHVDRRHDFPHSRVRSVAPRLDRPDGPQYDLRAEHGSAELRLRQDISGADQAAEPDPGAGRGRDCA